LAEGEKAHPANYRGCRHAKEELQERKTQRTPKITTVMVLSSNLITPDVSFAAALRGSGEQQKRPQSRDVPMACPPAAGKQNLPAPALQQETCQSVQAQRVNSQPLDNMLRAVIVVQQIMTEFNGALSEEDKIVAITEIVLNLKKPNGH
jgi:hypothetical protein